MSIFNEFPQTNFHELNLDWVIAKVKELADDWASSTENWETLYTNSNNLLEQSQNLIADFQEYVTNYFENLDLTDEVREEINRLNNNGTMAGIVAVALSGTVTTWLQNNITLPEGVVIDSGLTVQGAAADAKATGDLIRNLKNNNFFDLLSGNYTKNSTTHNGVTFEWIGDTCRLSGTASPTAFDNLIFSDNSFPTFLSETLGTDINVMYSGTNSYLHIAFYQSGSISDQYYIRGHQTISVPALASGIVIRLYVPSGNSVDETVDFIITPGKISDLITGFIKPLRFGGILGVNDDPADLDYNTIAVTTTQTPNIPISASGFIITVGNYAGFKGQYWIAGSNGRQYYRAKTANTDYTDWLDQATQYRNFTHAICYYGPAPDDLNDCPINSFTSDTGNRANNPAGGLTGYVLTVGDYSASHMQIFISYMSGDVYYRRGLAGVWYDWISSASSASGGNPRATMFSVGDSILTGSVWRNGVIDHLSAYYNAPYSVIATAINVSPDNVTHILLSDTGMLHDGGNGPYLDKILDTDFSNYDVLLSQFEFFDINEYPLGTAASAADRTTIAGTVKTLVNYVRQSNKNTQIILCSVPPCHWRYGAGANVFTTNYDQGYSLSDLDTVIRQIAEDMHFTYITYEDMAMSYYWQDLTDGNNVHLNNENSYRVFGAYIGGHASAQINF